MGFLVIFFRFKPVLSTCIWQFTNRKKFLCLTVMVKNTDYHPGCFILLCHLETVHQPIWTASEIYIWLHSLDCNKFVPLLFWLLHEPPENNKKFGFALVLIMQLFSKKVQVTLIINCTSSFKPSGSSYFNCLRHNILSVLLGRGRGVSRIRKPIWR